MCVGFAVAKCLNSLNSTTALFVEEADPFSKIPSAFDDRLLSGRMHEIETQLLSTRRCRSVTITLTAFSQYSQAEP